MNTRRFARGVVASVLCTALASLAQTSLAAPTKSWTITQLGSLSGRGSIALTLNNRGDVGGYSKAVPPDTTFDYNHPFIWSNGTMTDLGANIGTPAGHSQNQVSVINDHGTIVMQGQAGPQLVKNGQATRIMECGSANDLNNKDVVVGSYCSGMLGRAFSYADGVFADLGTLGGPWASASAINDRGTIVGTSYTSFDPTTVRGFVYENGTMTAIGTFGGTSSNAVDINSHGEIIGTAKDASGASIPYIIDRTGMHPLANVPANAALFAINDHGQVLGAYPNPNNQGQTQFIWENGTMTLLDPVAKAAGWGSIFVTDMNDRGWVTGWGWKTGGSTNGEAFLMVPKG